VVCECARGFLDDVTTRRRIAAVATAWRHQDRNPRLVLDNQLQHDVRQIGSVVSTRATSDVYDLFVWGRVAVRASIDMATGRVEVHAGGGEAQTLGGTHRKQTVEGGHPGFIERLHRTPPGILIALGRSNPGRYASRRGRIVEESGDQSARRSDTSEANEHHRFHGFPDGEVPHGWVVLGRLLKDLAEAEGIEPASDKAAVGQDWAVVHRVVGQDNLL